MGLKDIAIGGLKSWLNVKGYEVKKKTSRKRTTTTKAATTIKRTTTRKTTAAKTTTKPKVAKKTARKRDYDYERKADELDELIRRANNCLLFVYDTRYHPKVVRNGALNDYAKRVVAISNYLRKHGNTRPLDELDAFVDDVLVSGKQIKTRLKTAIPTKTKTTRQSRLKQRTMTNSKLTRMAKYR